jgi:hypothetical protein
MLLGVSSLPSLGLRPGGVLFQCIDEYQEKTRICTAGMKTYRMIQLGNIGRTYDEFPPLNRKPKTSTQNENTP